MATGYWDSTTAGTSGNTWSVNSNTASTFWTDYHPRKHLVDNPEHWTDDDTLAFVRLINHETKTGFIVEMVIKGDILITDPNIERRTMREFVPLLKWYANVPDTGKINDFFIAHPLDAPETK